MSRRPVTDAAVSLQVTGYDFCILSGRCPGESKSELQKTSWCCGKKSSIEGVLARGVRRDERIASGGNSSNDIGVSFARTRNDGDWEKYRMLNVSARCRGGGGHKQRTWGGVCGRVD